MNKPPSMPAAPKGRRPPAVAAQRGTALKTRALVIVVVLGILVRLTISFFAVGTNDAKTWTYFGQQIQVHGLVKNYDAESDMNHPPLPALWAAFIAGQTTSVFEFAFYFRMLTIAADVGTCAVLVAIGRKRGRPLWGWGAAAVFACNPVAILVSGYHTNTDSIYTFFGLLAFYFVVERGRHFWGGLALGAALNVKLIPVMLIAPLLSNCRTWRAASRQLMGLAFMATPFVILFFADRSALFKNVLGYKPFPDRWGVIYFLNEGYAAPHLREISDAVGTFYLWLGRPLVLGFAILSGVLGWMRPQRFGGYVSAAMAYAGFLVFAPGFAVQYMIGIVPLLILVNRRASWKFAAFGGMFLVCQYTVSWGGELPLYSHFHTRYLSPPGTLFGLLAWATLASFLCWSFTRKPDELTPVPAPQA